ncbi:hypothetical protein TcCL_ESM03065 [Trypanosoma cruzi]|nr:hypothetical protein TcCL_ESM03065 [Trypanosoma cruzi]
MQTSTSRARRVASPAKRGTKNSNGNPIMRGLLRLLAAPASSSGNKMQTNVAFFTTENASCGTTSCSRRAQSPSPSLLSLSENSSVALAHSPTCQKALVFLPPSHFEQQHRQTKVTPSFADFPQTRLLPHASTHLRSFRLPFRCSHHTHGRFDYSRLAALRSHQHHWGWFLA